eukprot:TRINITY_DN6295_c0_g1_i1.p1 TRINITY_DN6295_c0_g1~~TRINITY_DN6295_c0_g1_i1.p1  ORF type:complete len:447 (-),score=42.36 TRINITY_DN6295_c0_g1_i1:18-1232(-)
MTDIQEVAVEICPFCMIPFPIDELLAHVTIHDENEPKNTKIDTSPSLNDEELAQQLAKQEQIQLEKRSVAVAIKMAKADQEKLPLNLIVSENFNPNLDPAQQKLFVDRFQEEVEANKQFIENQKKMSYEELLTADPGTTHVIFFDVDNCTSEFEKITDLKSESIIVYLFGGPSLPKVPTTHLPAFSEMYKTRRLRIIYAGEVIGPNASDFALAFYSGILHQNTPKNVPFLIVSRDKGLKNVAIQLRMLGRVSYIFEEGLKSMMDLSSKVTCSSLLDFSDLMTSKDTKKNIKNNNSNQTTPQKSDQIATDPESTTSTEIKSQEDKNKTNMLDTSPEAMDMQITRVVDALLKQNVDQRPKNVKKLVNAMTAALKIPLTNSDVELLLSELVARNLIALIGSRVQYLF